MVFTVSLSSRISPRTSTVIFLERSPAATADVTSAMLRTCAGRLEAIMLTGSVRSFQDRKLAPHFDGDLLGEVAGRDRGRDVGDVAHLRGEVRGHHVDGLGEVFPRTGEIGTAHV